MKKLTGILLALVMVLSVFAFSACELDSTLNDKLDELTDRITEFEDRNKDLQKQVADLEEENNTLKERIIEMQNELNALKFVLTISVEETTLVKGEDFKVNVELKNQSGRDHEIVSQWLFLPSIHNWSFFGDDEIDPPEYVHRSFNNNGIISNIGPWGEEVNYWKFGSDLDAGTHALKFRAVFYLNWQQNNQECVEIWSNTITLNVQ